MDEIEDKLDEVVVGIIKINSGDSLPATKRKAIELTVRGYATDMLNLFKNINKTSLPGSDYDLRIHDLCIQFGITKSGDKFY